MHIDPQIRADNERTHNRGKDVSALKAFVEHASSIAHSLPDTSPSLAPNTACDRIEQAVQAIMDYNNYIATEKDQKWAITPDAAISPLFTTSSKTITWLSLTTTPSMNFPLRAVQRVQAPTDFKPMPAVGSGV